MITITDKHKIFLAIAPIDFRNRLDGTLAVCRNQLELDPKNGQLFIFRNKKLTTIRCIIYDNNGFWFMEKRLSKGHFLQWPTAANYPCCEMSASQLALLLNNQPLIS